MGSNYFGEPNMGNDGRGTGSSRKGKKNSDKPKQPQRGLGVAQLEKIRLHGQMGCSSYQYPPLPSPYPNNFHQEDMRLQSTGAAAYSSISTSSSFSYSSSSSASSASYGFQPNMMMGVGEYERGNIRYGDSQSTAASWNPSSGMLDTQHFGQPSMTRHFLSPVVEDAQPKKNKKHRNHSSVGSSSQNSESSETQEPDLELRLSL
ncbi:hypothetical protein SLE2022_267380 [Rubroshorea leprosula]